ncbi:Delphilin [Paragonimus heterotremus]|uniref:Delphilin n=1 Tax=Paragonimus heterotremus TaxID=100268 RepID=A0A8J4TIW8_9TREM|nr:Delphilin [Paragonimus heterotremus]
MCRKKHLKAGLDLNSLVNLAETDNSDGGKLVIPDGTGLATVNCGAIGTSLVPATVAATSTHINPTVSNKQSYLIQPPTSKTINQLSQPVTTYSTPSFRTVRPQNRQPTNNAQYFHFLLQRGPKGFGFTLAGDSPVYVSHVEQGSPANQCGVKSGDTIVAVDRMNVSRSTVNSVVRLFRTARNPVYFTVCRPITVQMQLPSVNRSSSGTRTISCLFQKSCFSQSKKSTSDNMVGSGNGFHANCHSSPGLNYSHQSSSPAYLLAPRTPFTTTTTTTTYLSCPLNNQIQPSPQITHHLSNSRSFYQLSMVPETSRTCLRNSKTVDRLCDQNYSMSPPCAIAMNVTQDEITAKPKQSILPPLPAMWETQVNTFLPTISSKDGSKLDVVSLPTMSSPTRQLSNTGPVSNLPTPPSVAKSTLPCLTVLMNPKVSLTETEQTPFNVDCLKYVHQVKHVDFRAHSPKLEHYGCLNLLESNCCSKVDLLMFTDLLLIAQRAPNRFFTVIKDPIYNSKVCYVNIPPYASDQLILQYIDDSNRKQIVHFQGPNVLEWFDWIQGHMVYNGNWWMGNM